MQGIYKYGRMVSLEAQSHWRYDHILPPAIDADHLVVSDRDELAATAPKKYFAVTHPPGLRLGLDRSWTSHMSRSYLDGRGYRKLRQDMGNSLSCGFKTSRAIVVRLSYDNCTTVVRLLSTTPDQLSH